MRGRKSPVVLDWSFHVKKLHPLSSATQITATQRIRILSASDCSICVPYSVLAPNGLLLIRWLCGGPNAQTSGPVPLVSSPR